MEANTEEKPSITAPICLIIDSGDITFTENGPGYIGKFKVYKTIENSPRLTHITIKAGENGFITDYFYDRENLIFLNVFSSRKREGPYDYKKFAGFFQLYQIMPIQDIRIYIFRFIGALFFKESNWRYTTTFNIKHDLSFEDMFLVLQRIKKWKMEEIYLTYFKDRDC